jgi:hypothetical protein
MNQIFGHFDTRAIRGEEYLILRFSPGSLPLKQRWRNNGLSADFLADYLASFFPAEEIESDGIDKRTEIKGAVSYIANELLENAMKFNDDDTRYPISIQLQLYVDHIIFCVSNSVNIETTIKFQEHIKKLLNSDTQELYLQQLEQNASSDGNCFTSGLGLLTMINDYMAQLGWKFETIETDREVTVVTTMVNLAV